MDYNADENFCLISTVVNIVQYYKRKEFIVSRGYKFSLHLTASRFSVDKFKSWQRRCITQTRINLITFKSRIYINQELQNTSRIAKLQDLGFPPCWWKDLRSVHPVYNGSQCFCNYFAMRWLHYVLNWAQEEFTVNGRNWVAPLLTRWAPLNLFTLK